MGGEGREGARERGRGGGEEERECVMEPIIFVG